MKVNFGRILFGEILNISDDSLKHVVRVKVELERGPILISSLIGENLIKSDPLESHNGSSNLIDPLMTRVSQIQSKDFEL